MTKQTTIVVIGSLRFKTVLAGVYSLANYKTVYEKAF